MKTMTKGASGIPSAIENLRPPGEADQAGDEATSMLATFHPANDEMIEWTNHVLHPLRPAVWTTPVVRAVRR